MSTDYHELKRVPTNELSELVHSVDLIHIVQTICDRIDTLEQIIERVIDGRNNISD